MKKAALMKTKLLALLRRRWTTPLDALQHCGCLSLSQRCGEFARDGINVAKDWRDTPTGKRVRAYRIVGGK